MFKRINKNTYRYETKEFFLEYNVVFYNLEYAVNWVAFIRKN